MKHGIALLSFLSIATIIYFFFSDVIFQKCKKYKKIKCLICSCIFATFCVFIYIEIHKPPHTIQMKEDVLYVHPKSQIPTSNTNDIYDGSENDPNVKSSTEESVKMQENILYKVPKSDTTKKKEK